MNRLFVVLAVVVCLSTPVLANEAAPKERGNAPLTMSFPDLKWTELPERKGMQFAVLSGDPKTGHTRRCARFQPEPASPAVFSVDRQAARFHGMPDCEQRQIVNDRLLALHEGSGGAGRTAPGPLGSRSMSEERGGSR